MPAPTRAGSSSAHTRQCRNSYYCTGTFSKAGPWYPPYPGYAYKLVYRDRARPGFTLLPLPVREIVKNCKFAGSRTTLGIPTNVYRKSKSWLRLGYGLQFENDAMQIFESASPEATKGFQVMRPRQLTHGILKSAADRRALAFELRLEPHLGVITTPASATSSCPT